MAWYDELQPASWRGIGFSVVECRTRKGRRVAVHEYPDRDVIWVEDLGRAARAYDLIGYLVGDDVQAQRQAFDTACEIAGSGLLIHPSLGPLTVSLAGAAEIGESVENGRMVAIQLSFLETATTAVFPGGTISTAASVAASILQTANAVTQDLIAAVTDPLGFGLGVLSGFIGSFAPWATSALSLAGDASQLFHSVSGLVAASGYEYSRFAAGSRSAPQDPNATVSSLLAAGATERAALAAAVAVATTAAAAVSTDPTTLTTFSTAVQAVAMQVAACAADPADQVRMLATLAAYTPDTTSSADAIGLAISAAIGAVGDLCRRASLAALAQACAAYQPSSNDDAVALETQVSTLFDAEILIAGDAGDDTSFMALKALRSTVIADIEASGASLAPLMKIDTATSLPAPMLAYAQYQDASRADQMAQASGAIHPAFLPTEFTALAS